MTRTRHLGLAVCALAPCLLSLSCLKKSTFVEFTDDFESYAESSYPAEGGWYQLWSGRSAQVTSQEASSGSKSFMLSGTPNWVRADGINLDLSGVERLVFQFSVMVQDGSSTGALAGFFERVSSNESREHNAVAFSLETRCVHIKGATWIETSHTWETERWYTVRVELDFGNETMDVWVDDSQIADDLRAEGRDVSSTFQLSTLWRPLSGTSVAFFDDVTIDTL